MAGTYFYHSHVGLQAISCTGPMIITEADKNPAYHYDGERIVFLTDVWQQEERVIQEGLEHQPIIYAGDQEMVLINGKGGGTRDGVRCNDTLSVINVDPNRTYRFRFIGGTANTIASIGIEGHPSLAIIEADGADTHKFNTSFIQIGSGQRFSALIETLKKPKKQYYYIQLESRERETFVRSYAVLNYGKPISSSTQKFMAPLTPPVTLPPTDNNWLEYQLKPRGNSIYRAGDLPEASEVTRRINITVHLSLPGLPAPKLVYLQNGKAWGENTVDEPYLVSLYKNNGKNFPSMERALLPGNDGLDPVTVAFPFKIGEVVEIVLQNTGSDVGGMETHPWHAHGAHYWDLGSGRGVYNQAENEAKWARSPGKPVKRDTTMLFGKQVNAGNYTLSEWRAWRLRVTQPGVWMVHCHILPHMIFGMQTVWVMGNASQVMSADYPDVKGYLEYGGSVMGNETHHPEVAVVNFDDAWTESQ